MDAQTVTSEEYWAKKGGVDLFVFRKRVAGVSDRPILFLVHGSSLAARTGFDLTVPGKADYSMMDRFARLGFDVWTMDHENYGRSSRTDSYSDIRSGADDLAAAFEIVERETGRKAASLYGSSSGALRAALFAELHPERAERLILDAFVWTGEGSPTLAKRSERLEEYRANPKRTVDRAFFHSIFNRDKPGLVEEGVADAFADAELQYDGTVPTGTYIDMCANLPVVDPSKITCPVQILRGEHDGIATERDILNFFEALGTTDKQVVIIPGQAHVGTLSLNRHRLFHVMLSFLTMPQRLDPER